MVAGRAEWHRFARDWVEAVVSDVPIRHDFLKLDLLDPRAGTRERLSVVSGKHPPQALVGIGEP